MDMLRKDDKEQEAFGTADEQPWGTIAVVVKMPLCDMPELIRAVQGVPSAHIVYKRTSAGRLMIVEER
jgi:hypothetical protein